MPWYVRVALGVVAVFSACGSAAEGQEKAKPKAKVELRWVETKQIGGLTEDKGFPASSDGKELAYAHKKPALVLTAAEVSAVHLTKHDLTKNNLGVHYMVTLHLTKDARAKLAATVEGKQTRYLTVVVDGKYWGIRRYEKGMDPKFVPEGAHADSFVPDVGYFSSKAEAQRLVDAFK